MISVENISYSIRLFPNEEKKVKIILAFIDLVFKSNVKQ